MFNGTFCRVAGGEHYKNKDPQQGRIVAVPGGGKFSLPSDRIRSNNLYLCVAVGKQRTSPVSKQNMLAGIK